MKTISIFHTHIEVYPYVDGENPIVEKMFSIWDDVSHSYDPYGYIVHNNKLYLPRGANIIVLQKQFENSDIKVIRKYDELSYMKNVNMIHEPKNVIQEESVDFLSGNNSFKRTRRYSQLSLNLDTGDGKTFCTINSIVNSKYKSIIITHVDKIKNQWIEEFLNHTDINEDDIVNISGTDVINMIMKNKISGNIYVVNHQTLQSYYKNNGYDALSNFFKKICVGIKIYDEAHLEFKNILRIDFFTNTKKTFYLTANFSRSDINEKKLFNKAFSNVAKFGEDTINYSIKRKHIVYLPVLYDSKASSEEISSFNTYYGFSANRFIEYAFNNDSSDSMKIKLSEIINKVKTLEGRILITNPKTEITEKIKNYIEEMDISKSIGTIHSKNKIEDNLENSKCDIISSTIRSCGTGVNIDKIRVLINLEPYASEITANQLAGRLREYSPDLDTYYFDLIDISVPKCYNMYKQRLKFLKKKCKKIVIYK